MSTPLLWYFADPMCSWCWGFSPVISALRERYHDRVNIALVLGGLRRDTAPLDAAGRRAILSHWHEVQVLTGQPFRFEGALPDGFVYDSEPACRAVAAMGTLDPTQVFAMFNAIQSAFYVRRRDVTQPQVLADCAVSLGVERDRFLDVFDSDAARARIQAHFLQTLRAGVRAFPTLILQQNEHLVPASQGCQSLRAVRAAIERHLAPSPI
jgi:putative protein-disulfide isomerase